MPKMLFCWEQGQGSGHILPFRDIILRLAEHDIKLVLAAQDVAIARSAVRSDRVRIIQAPFVRSPRREWVKGCATFNQVMLSLGYHNAISCRALLQCWIELIRSECPSIVVTDFAPSAVIASHVLGFEFARIGTGYTVPPCNERISTMKFASAVAIKRIESDEEKVNSRVSNALHELGFDAFPTLSQCYQKSSADILRTVQQFDHYSRRESGGHYVGAWSSSKQTRLPPTGEGPIRIFAYLKPFPNLRPFLQAIAQISSSFVVCADGIEDDDRRVDSSVPIKFVDDKVDLSSLSSAFDLVITNGNQNTTLHSVLSGVPVGVVSLHEEQAITGRIVKSLGIGTWVRSQSPECFDAFASELSRAVLQRQTTMDFSRSIAVPGDPVTTCVDILLSAIR
tara:strand:+ start:1989 stop:3173 length:1185 start_codon:yes stop_codon:yes gene_type:complete